MKSKYFKLHELVPRELYKKYGEKAWRYVDTRLIETIDRLKEEFPKGTMTINNYGFGGNREWSGIRTGSSEYYSVGSQHSYGNAFDIVFSDYDIENVQKWVIKNRNNLPIKGLEIKVSWLHIDVRNEDDLVIFDSSGNVYDYKLNLR